MRVTVMGLGRFGGGVGAVRALTAAGHRVTVTDAAGADDLRESLAAIADCPGVLLTLGGHRTEDFADADLVVASPAIPTDHPHLAAARARGVPVTTEIALFLRAAPCPVVGVSGSNGKTTTANLLAALLCAAGHDARCVGNMGISLLPETSALPPRAVVVAELSSFQLEYLDPDHTHLAGAVLTNVTPNHLDRHGTFAAYRAAKRRLVDLVADGAPLVVDGACSEATSLVTDADRSRLRVRLIQPQDVAACPRPRRLLGDAHHTDFALAVALAEAVRPPLPAAAVTAVAAAFAPLEHRLEVVCEWRGVRWIDDSKSTTPEACRAGLAAVQGSVHLVAGGADKGIDPAPMLGPMSGCRTLHLIGGTAAALARSLAARGVAAAVHEDLDGAVRACADLAKVGDVVLLSPGHASYGLFPDYRARGRAFRAAIARLAGSESTLTL